MAIAIGIGLLAQGLYPADLPESRNPDFVDNVFDNRGVLWAAGAVRDLGRNAGASQG